MKLDEFGEKAATVVRENIAHLIFGVVVLLMILLSFVQVHGNDGKLDVLGMCINISLQVAIFVPYRWRQKRLSGQVDTYRENKRLYAQKVSSINAQNNLGLFGKFCELKTAELKRVRQLSIVHAAGIDTAVYDSGEYAGLSAEQKNAIKKAARVKVKPINPLCITSNSTRVKGYGIDFDETAEDAKSMLAKIVPMLVWGVVLTYIALDAITEGGLKAAVMIVFRLVMCFSAMFSGITSGEGFVIKKDKVIMRRIDFINLFNEWGIENGKIRINDEKGGSE